MKYLVGVFGSRADAEGATRAFRSTGISRERLNSLTPKASERELAAVPTIAAEQPGVGKALGGVVGGALGLAGGLGIGSVIESPHISGIPLPFAGLAVVVLLCIVGTLGGMAVGSALDDALSEGLPVDEFFIYQSALRQGRSVLIAAAAGDAEADAFRALLVEHGAETIDAAHQEWLVGLCAAEEQNYVGSAEAFGPDRSINPHARANSYEQALEFLRRRYGRIEAESTDRSGQVDKPGSRRRVA